MIKRGRMILGLDNSTKTETVISELEKMHVCKQAHNQSNKATQKEMKSATLRKATQNPGCPSSLTNNTLHIYLG
jgi:hypothetical protein